VKEYFKRMQAKSINFAQGKSQLQTYAVSKQKVQQYNIPYQPSITTTVEKAFSPSFSDRRSRSKKQSNTTTGACPSKGHTPRREKRNFMVANQLQHLTQKPDKAHFNLLKKAKIKRVISKGINDSTGT